MMPLNLPPFDYRIKKTEGKLWIFDVIRKKYIVLIPEEWVRQHFIHYILHTLHYPRSLVTVETGLNYNQRMKRTDIVVFDRLGKPWMVIECKAPEITLDEKTLFQASVYNNTLRAKYITVTNGIRHLYAEVNFETSETKWLSEMPSYDEKNAG